MNVKTTLKTIATSITVGGIALLVIAFITDFSSPTEYLAIFFNIEEWQIGDIAVITSAFLIVLVIFLCRSLLSTKTKAAIKDNIIISSPELTSKSQGTTNKNKYTYLIIVFMALVITIGSCYGVYYMTDSSHKKGYAQGVKDCEKTITEGITKGDTPSGDIIYYTESGTVIHKSPNCYYLKKAKKVLNAPISSKSDWKKCSKCW